MKLTSKTMDEVNVLKKIKNGPKNWPQIKKKLKKRRKLLIIKDRNYWDKSVRVSSLGWAASIGWISSLGLSKVVASSSISMSLEVLGSKNSQQQHEALWSQNLLKEKLRLHLDKSPQTWQHSSRLGVCLGIKSFELFDCLVLGLIHRWGQFVTLLSKVI